MIPTGDGAGPAAVVVLAGGSGTRVGGARNKVYLPVAGAHVISWSFRWAARLPQARRFVLVVRRQDQPLAEQILAADCPRLPVEYVPGGDSRHESEQAALDHLSGAIRAGEIALVAVHDGARPLAGPELFRAVLATAEAVGGAVPATPATGLIGEPGAGAVPDGHELVRVQTPQAFRAGPLLQAYRRARETGFQGTDTASCVRALSDVPVQIVPGDPDNVKVTFAGDLPLVERLLAGRAGPS